MSKHRYLLFALCPGCLQRAQKNRRTCPPPRVVFVSFILSIWLGRSGSTPSASGSFLTMTRSCIRGPSPLRIRSCSTCCKRGMRVIEAPHCVNTRIAWSSTLQAMRIQGRKDNAHIGNRERTCTLTRFDPHTDGNSRAAMGSHWKVPRMRVNAAERCSKMEWTSSSGGMQG